ncbi:MAG TPA: manganese ABC transporter ATP-binding protein [Cyanobacteria bacterium UBA11149]|nr:manganese ABC transporter ATP-binding protein [Cyanobacteria bacterium UBA11367]HBE58806.1 manganese ABC transporter ATP-binding protein [Cyanobacteria bacterium UBA11366]HBK64394.1 manganese ABC transporter ATP-binding protein [Cyanobacteria bacterium UBA11166]HBR73416.1 manganese ABC transporter ATP-binding protein [Cyanobacteria bacterium UBA11159]HBS68116.1 manganese ABC transporter ATP-binding protein [Cyanobacteria bacterium UBA11153]HBW90182.1 manganese ABC transporter ATP-binding pr
MVSIAASNVDWRERRDRYSKCDSIAMETLRIEALSVEYRTVEALQGINCEIKPGRLTGIIGPNGAGKSTLMKAMLGLVGVSNGRATYQKKQLMDELEAVTYVPQRSQIDWTYPATVWDVVLMGRVRKTGWFRRFSSVSRRIAMEALERVGMSEFKNRPIGQLSGGQQQRVFLAKALAEEADILFFDEPLAGIDKKTEGVVFEILHELADACKIVLVVHHDLGEAIANFDDLILLNRELIAWGSRQEVMSRENLRRAYGGEVAFFGSL